VKGGFLAKIGGKDDQVYALNQGRGRGRITIVISIYGNRHTATDYSMTSFWAATCRDWLHGQIPRGEAISRVCPITLMGLQACYNSSNMRLMASRTLTLCREEEDSGLSTDGEALAVLDQD